MFNEKELLILNKIRKNSRITLKKISRDINIPVSTIFDNLKRIEEKIIIKYVTILDFSKIGYKIRVAFMIKSKNKQEFLKNIIEDKNINSISKIMNDYDYHIDTIFTNLSDLFKFKEKLYELGAERIKEHHIIDELKTEDINIEPNSK